MATAPAVPAPKAQALTFEPLQRFVIYNVPWAEYEALCKLWDGRHFRMTYDRGTLELMTTSYLHERYKSLWRRLVETLSLELDVDIASGGGMTFKRQLKERGLEPDECYWVLNAANRLGRADFDIEADPKPDLVLEIEVTNSALDKLDIYAKLGFPEVWRFDGSSITVHQLQPDATYVVAEVSRSFPDLSMAELARWLLRGREMAENPLIRAFAAWVRAGMPRGEGAA